MKLTIVLVNFKSNKEKLQSCLNSIRINTEVLLVDHSHDFTFEGIKIPQNLDIRIIKNIHKIKTIKEFTHIQVQLFNSFMLFNEKNKTMIQQIKEKNRDVDNYIKKDLEYYSDKNTEEVNYVR